MKTPTVCIDLGAAYTKVAYRKPFPMRKPGRFAERESEVVMVEGSAMIPSILIFTGDRRNQWIAGRRAAGMKQGAGHQLLQNWKSRFYSKEFDTNTGDLVSAAEAFFGWLLDGVSEAGVPCGSDTLVRVTFPVLDSISKQKEALKQCMVRSGWQGRIDLIPEPVANMIGAFSGGRNFISASGDLSYGPIFRALGSAQQEPNPLFGEIREYVALRRRKRQLLTVTVIDCGSFTLDMATVNIDLLVTEHEVLPVDVDSAESWTVGITEQVDNQCLPKIFRRHGVEIANVSFETQELAKVDLYRGKAYSLPVLPKPVIVGESLKDKEIINDALITYCQSVWGKIEKNWQNPEVVILTGGGVSIGKIRTFLHERLKRLHVKAIQSGTSNNFASKIRKANGLVRWVETGETLGRLATALGGASVAFGYEPDEASRQYIPRGTPL